jgi:hypothetical protein
MRSKMLKIIDLSKEARLDLRTMRLARTRITKSGLDLSLYIKSHSSPRTHKPHCPQVSQALLQGIKAGLHFGKAARRRESVVSGAADTIAYGLGALRALQ